MSKFVRFGDGRSEKYVCNVLGIEVTSADQILLAFAASSIPFEKLENDYESGRAVFLVAFSLLGDLDDAKAVEVVLAIAKSIVESTIAAPEPRIAVLAALFNSATVPAARAQTYASLLAFALAHGLVEPIKPSMDVLKKWTKTWHEHPNLVLDVWNKAVACWTGDTAQQGRLEILKLAQQHDFEVEDVAVASVKFALTSETTFTFDVLASMPAFQALEKSHPALFKLVHLLQKATVEEFMSSRRELLDEAGLTSAEDLLLSKMRTLTLCSVGTGSFQLEVLQDRLAADSVADVENFVVDAVSSGVIDARISQDEAKVVIHRVTFRCLDKAVWEVMGKRLAAWRDHINNVLTVHDNHASHTQH